MRCNPSDPGARLSLTPESVEAGVGFLHMLIEGRPGHVERLLVDRFAPHQLRHAHAVELAREGVALNVIQRQLGHANLGVTSIYLQGIDAFEIVNAVHTRRAPVI
jgi:integrase